VLKRLGLNRLSKLEPLEPPNRYCRRHPGELIHLDIKTLGRFSKPGKRTLGLGAGHRTRGAGLEACSAPPPAATTTPTGQELSCVSQLPDRVARHHSAVGGAVPRRGQAS
jgi:hypothetical protein